MWPVAVWVEHAEQVSMGVEVAIEADGFVKRTDHGVRLSESPVDHCVRATALDAASEGFATTVLLDLTAGVAGNSTDRALAQMREAGVRLISS